MQLNIVQWCIFSRFQENSWYNLVNKCQKSSAVGKDSQILGWYQNATFTLKIRHEKE